MVSISAKASFKDKFEKFDVDGFVGGNIRINTYDRFSAQMQTDAKTGGLIMPDVFAFANAGIQPTPSTYVSKKEVRSIYAKASVGYENMLYLERPGCNLCMGNQEKAAKGDTVMATSTRLFQGRVVEDTEGKKGESLLSSTPVVVLSTILGRTPTLDEYTSAVEGINLTKFAPSNKQLVM